MNQNKIARFNNSLYFFRCPICKKELSLKGNSLYCINHHCYDISKYGYINFFLNGKQSVNYTKDTFLNRKVILDMGYYSHVLQELFKLLDDFSIGNTVLDVGCGEGYYSRAIQEQFNKTILAFDKSKNSIQIAARNDNNNSIKWFVCDLEKLPLKNQCVDCVLDIFSPANYSEFNRVLKPGGYVIKIVPGKNHLTELRHIAQNYLRNKEYSNERVVKYFKQHYSFIAQKKCSVTLEISHEELKSFINMTPLFFGVNKNLIEWEKVERLTIEAELLVGKI